jgi:hypothetical protein
MSLWRRKQAGCLGREEQTLCCPPSRPPSILQNEVYKRVQFFSLGRCWIFIFVFQKPRPKWIFFTPARFGVLVAMSNTISLLCCDAIRFGRYEVVGGGWYIHLCDRRVVPLFRWNMLPPSSGQLTWRSQVSRLPKSHRVIPHKSVMLIYTTLSYSKSHNNFHVCSALSH